MLERVLLHQTRLRVPGVGLDARGIALGKRGLLLFASLDRVAAFLGVYSHERDMSALLPSLHIEVVQSRLGTREVVLSCEIDGADRMDGLARAAKWVGGYAFTGSARHFVQYRDASAPFGYDAAELVATDAHLALYHDEFTQSYELERTLSLRRLLVWLTLRRSEQTAALGDESWLLCEPGLSGPVIRHLLAAGVTARGTVFTTSNVGLEKSQRWLFNLSKPPSRLRALLTGTPGITAFVAAAPGVLVQYGHRHVVSLASCNPFAGTGLVLLFAGSEPPLELAEAPQLFDVRELLELELAPDRTPEPAIAAPASPLQISLRVVSTASSLGALVASFVPPEQYPLLRQLAYWLPARVLAETRVAFTNVGAALLCHSGVELIPIGSWYRQLHAAVFVQDGYAVVPALTAELVRSAYGASAQRLVFVRANGPALAIDADAFVPLERAVLHTESWISPESRIIPPITDEPATLWYERLPLNALRRAERDE